MSSIDVDDLLSPISEDDPAGPDLEYDPAFLAAFRAAEGTPDRRMGDTVVPGEEPDWRALVSATSDLLGRTKDLRVCVLLARALLRLNGLQGLDQGLNLVQGLTRRYWDEVNPRLDPDDDNDPTIRVNVLLELCSPELVLHAVRTAPVARSRAFGPISYRDLEVTEGRLSAPPDAHILDSATLNGALLDCPVEDLQATSAALERSIAHLDALSAGLAERIRTDQLPSFDPLGTLLKAIARWLGGHLAERIPNGADAAPAPAEAADGTAAPAGAAVPHSAAPGTIASRDDVVRTLDRICDYYSRHEPSSPVPLLLRRAQRLAVADFMAIMRDMAPDALTTIETICGDAGEES